MIKALFFTTILAIGLSVGGSNWVSAQTAAPAARAATSSEIKLFAQFAPSPPPAPFIWVMNMYAVAGQYALVGFSNPNSGIMALLQNVSGHWTLIERTGGQITVQEMQDETHGAMSAVTAESLYKLTQKQTQVPGVPIKLHCSSNGVVCVQQVQESPPK